ncbi:MAG: anaerobic ribonucleoside-triphosphate reductase activating protein [Desulfovibrio sp.]|nr:anaerobic ribonucleoside-triphosphate reductase activating protein [Desulfovibrio sp.]
MSVPEIALAGMHKLTALDYPGLVSAIVFTRGCNFDCPYCHNLRLKGKVPPLDPRTVLLFLKKRAGLLDGLVVSGGEPTLQEGLASFCAEVKSLGYRVKLDTNGSRPEVLGRLLRESLVDYVAMDCKTAPGDYASAFCPEPDIEEKIRASAGLLRESKVAHEFRTTCVSPFVGSGQLRAMAEMTGRDSPWFVQEARPGRDWTGDCAPMPPQAMRELLFLAEGFGTRPRIRNY